MKRVLSFILMLVMSSSFMLTLISCNSDEEEQSIDDSIVDDNNQVNDQTDENEKDDKWYLNYILSAEDEKWIDVSNRYKSFDTLTDKFNEKLEDQSLISINSSNEQYTLYVDKNTGEMYYLENSTGNIVSSNTSDTGDGAMKALQSQVQISYESVPNVINQMYTYDAYLNGNISVEQTENGIEVSYVLSNRYYKCFIPERMSAAKFESMLLIPMLNKFRDLMVEYCADDTYNGVEYDIFKSPKYNLQDENIHRSVYYKGTINLFGVRTYLTDMDRIIDSKFNASNGNRNSDEFKVLQEMYSDILRFYAAGVNAYRVVNVNNFKVNDAHYVATKEEYYNNAECEISKTLEPMYVLNCENLQQTLAAARIFAKYLPEYTKEDMVADETYCGITYATEEKIEFKCSIRYSINSDGYLCVSFHDNRSETNTNKFSMVSIELLNYFSGNYIILNENRKFATDGTVTEVVLY